MYPRDRWTGHRKTLRDCGVPSCVHNMQAPVYDQFLRDLGEKPVAAPAMDARDRLAIAGLPRMVALMDDSHLQANGGRDVGRADAGASGVGRGNGNFSETIAKENAAHRQEGHAYTDSNPGSETIVMSMLSRPLETTMDELLAMAMDQWGMNEKAKMTSCAPADLLGNRTWPLLHVALHGTESKLYDRLQHLQQNCSDALRALPHGDKTVNLRHALFLGIGRQHSRAHELWLRHEALLYKLVRLIRHPAEKAAILELCENMAGEFEADFIE